MQNAELWFPSFCIVHCEFCILFQFKHYFLYFSYRLGKGHPQCCACRALVAAAAEFGADRRGIIAGNGPNGHFHAVFAVFPESRRHFHTGNRPGEPGNIVHVLFAGPEAFFHGLGNGADRPTGGGGFAG